MNKRNLLIIGGVVITLFSVIGVFVFKVSGSNSVENVSGCTPYNIRIEKGENPYSADVSWQTEDICSGFLTYGDEADSLKRVAVDIVNGVKSREHSVTLDSLVTTKSYYFSIISDSVNYGKNGLPVSFSISSL